jgi:hypothetical protein
MPQGSKRQKQLTWIDAVFFAMTVVGMLGFLYVMVYR